MSKRNETQFLLIECTHEIDPDAISVVLPEHLQDVEIVIAPADGQPPEVVTQARVDRAALKRVARVLVAQRELARVFEDIEKYGAMLSSAIERARPDYPAARHAITQLIGSLCSARAEISLDDTTLARKPENDR